MARILLTNLTVKNMCQYHVSYFIQNHYGNSVKTVFVKTIKKNVVQSETEPHICKIIIKQCISHLCSQAAAARHLGCFAAMLSIHNNMYSHIYMWWSQHRISCIPQHFLPYTPLQFVAFWKNRWQFQKHKNVFSNRLGSTISAAVIINYSLKNLKSNTRSLNVWMMVVSINRNTPLQCSWKQRQKRATTWNKTVVWKKH